MVQRDKLSHVSKNRHNANIIKIGGERNGGLGGLYRFDALFVFSHRGRPLQIASSKAEVEPEVFACGYYLELRPFRDVSLEPYAYILVEVGGKLAEHYHYTLALKQLVLC